MDLLHLVDRIEELLATAQKMPIGNRAIVDRRRMLDLIDQMRITIPHEVREAQEIVSRRDQVLREAEEDRRLVEAQAQERASRMVEAHEITHAARARAEEIAREAERRLQDRIDEANRDIAQRIEESRTIAREQMRAADEYARDLLERLERQLGTFVKSVRSGIEQLEPTPPPLSRVAVPRAELTRMEIAPPPRETGDSREDYEERLERLERERLEREPVEREAPGRASVRQERTPPAAPRDGDDDGLENLLQPRRGRTVAPSAAADAGVIDDFANEPLDDDPMFRQRAREDSD